MVSQCRKDASEDERIRCETPARTRTLTTELMAAIRAQDVVSRTYVKLMHEYGFM